jgi:hypothetical protein
MIVFALLGLLTPRLIMVLLWIFSNYLDRAYHTGIVPLLGFFLLPTTTLCYAIATNDMHGFRGWGAVLIVAGVFVDAGFFGSGRGALKRKQ